MPSIQPARLKQQAAMIAELYPDSQALVRSLRALFETYTDHTHRAGLSNPPSSLLVTYRVPAPVLRQVLVDLKPRVRQQPEAALALCDALWSEPIYEFRLLAISLLGLIDPQPAEPVIERLRSWIKPLPEEPLLACLVDTGLARLRQENLTSLLPLVKEWLGTQEQDSQKGALWILKSLATDPAHQDLPSVFRMLTPYLRLAPPALRPDILEVLVALAHRSPQETAHLLHQSLAVSDNTDTAWLIRQVLAEFPEEIQKNLRSLQRNG